MFPNWQKIFSQQSAKQITSEERLQVIKEVEGGLPVVRACLKHNISRHTFYQWHSRYQQADRDDKLASLQTNYASGKLHWRPISSEIE